MYGSNKQTKIMSQFDHHGWLFYNLCLMFVCWLGHIYKQKKQPIKTIRTWFETIQLLKILHRVKRMGNERKVDIEMCIQRSFIVETLVSMIKKNFFKNKICIILQESVIFSLILSKIIDDDDLMGMAVCWPSSSPWSWSWIIIWIKIIIWNHWSLMSEWVINFIIIMAILWPFSMTPPSNCAIQKSLVIIFFVFVFCFMTNFNRKPKIETNPKDKRTKKKKFLMPLLVIAVVFLVFFLNFKRQVSVTFVPLLRSWVLLRALFYFLFFLSLWSHNVFFSNEIVGWISIKKRLYWRQLLIETNLKILTTTTKNENGAISHFSKNNYNQIFLLLL